MSANISFAEIKKDFPGADAHFGRTAQRLFQKKEAPQGADEFLRTHIEQGRRVRRICQQVFMRQIREGVPPGMSSAEYIHTKEFVSGLTAIQAFNHRGSVIKEDRAIDLRAILARYLTENDTGLWDSAGLANPEIEARVYADIKASFLANSLADRNSRYAFIMEAPTECISELERDYIAHEKIDDDTKGALTNVVTELKEHRLRFLSPGREFVLKARAVPAMLKELQKKIESNDSPKVLEFYNQVNKVLPQVEALLRVPKQPGDDHFEEAREALLQLAALNGKAQEAKLEMPDVLSELMALDQAIVGLTHEFNREFDVETYLKEYAQNLSKRFEELSKNFAEAPFKGETLKGLFFRYAGNVNTSISAIKNTEEDTRENKIDAEMEYVRLVDSYLKLCKGPDFSFDGMDASHNVAFVDASAALLAAVSPESLLADSGDGPNLRDSLLAMKTPLLETDREALEDAGVIVSDRDYSFSLLLDEWSGALPKDQIGMERVIAGYSLMERVNQLDADLALEVATLFKQKSKDKITEAQYESKAKEAFTENLVKLRTLRNDLLQRVETTVARGIERGVDELPALTGAQKELFALILESQRREDKAQYDQYLSQQTELMQDGFVDMPASWMMGEPISLSSVSSLSDAELSAKLQAAKGESAEEYSTALAMYTELKAEIRGDGQRQAPFAGYQDLLRALDQVGSRADDKLTPKFNGVMSVENGLIVKNDNWQLFVSEHTDKILNELGFALTDSYGRVAEFFTDYVESNDKHQQAELLARRSMRYLYMFRGLFGGEETQEKVEASTSLLNRNQDR